MKSKLSTALAAAGCALAFSVGAAKADTTFDIFGTFTEGAGGTLSGAMTIGPNIANVVSMTGMNVVCLCSWAAVFSCGGDGVGKSPEHPARMAHVVCCNAGVSSWHKCEVPAWLAHVRYRGNTGRHLLAVSLSESGRPRMAAAVERLFSA
jgi:hypothetical protein